jgi:bacillithiol system protein YtxJ
MSFINKIFGSTKQDKEEKVLPWITLNLIDQLHEIEDKSKIKTQVIFKHSTRCGISRMVLNQFVSNYNFTEKELDLYYLDLLSYRNVSDEVGFKFQVFHQSPQLLVIKNGEVVAHESHGAIQFIDLEKYL